MTAPSPIASTTMALANITKGDNPRRYFDRRKHEDLVASIRLRGVLQPILLRPAPNDPGRYAIVAGERRYRAALEAFGDAGEIPAVVREMSDQEALEAAIDENDVRDDASETEQADAAVRVLAACNGEHAEAARRLGWSRAKLDRRLALASLSMMVKSALDDRRIKVGHAELLAAVPADKQDRALATILASGLDVAKTRELLMRVTQSLAAAAFDKGECTTCPFNSGTQRALFETHVDDGHCTNPGCFQLKTEAADTARLAAEAMASAAVDEDGSHDDDATDDEDGLVAPPEPATLLGSSPTLPGTPQPTTSAAAARVGSTATKSTVTAKSIAARTTDLREATWRKALARTLAADAAKARSTILVAAMSGILPSSLNERRPAWMLASNAACSKELPSHLRRALAKLRAAHRAVRRLQPERNAWHFIGQEIYEYMPGAEDCSSLPPLTLVPVEQFAREIDDIARPGMEYGFMDVAGLCPLSEPGLIDSWFASLRVGVDFLIAAQELIQLEPHQLVRVR